MRRFSLVVCGLSIILLAFAARPAVAHANLVHSEPAAGAVLDNAPDTVKLWFSEVPEPTLSKVQLFDRAGNSIGGVGSLHVDPADATLLSSQLPPLQPGVYTIIWRTASAVDAHATTGGFAFVIGHDQALIDSLSLQSAGNASTASEVSPIAVVIRLASYLGLALLVGGFAFVPFVLHPTLKVAGEQDIDTGLHRLVLLGWLMLLIASIASALFESSSTGADLIALLTTTRFGLLFGLRIAVLVCIGLLLALRRSGLRWWYAGLALNGVLLLIISLNSHAAALPEPILPVIADVLHIAAMSVWLGGLVALLITLRYLRRVGNHAQDSFVLVSRFSNVAMVCVAGLALTGVIQIFFQVGDLYNLLITSYGLALVVKLLLIVPLLSLGALNLFMTRRKITKAIDATCTEDAFPNPVRLVMRSVTGEITLIAAVLAVTGVLTNSPPAREAFGSGAVMHGQAADLNIVVAVNPGLPGLNTFDIYVKDSLFQPVKDAQKVALIFGMLEHDMGAEEATATEVGDGHYVVRGSYISMIGTWHAEVLVRRAGMYDARTTLPLPVLALKQPPTSPTLLAPSRAKVGLAILIISALLFGGAQYLRRRQPHLHRVLLLAGVLTIILGMGIGATGFGSGMTSMVIAENPISADAASLQRGQQLYIDNCLACHGETGAGDGPVGASLKPPPANLQIQLKAKYTDGQLFDLLTRGIPSSTMPGFGMNLSDQDRWDVINYIEAFADRR